MFSVQTVFLLLINQTIVHNEVKLWKVCFFVLNIFYNNIRQKVVSNVSVTSVPVVTQSQTKPIPFKEEISENFLYLIHKHSYVLVMCSFGAFCMQCTTGSKLGQKDY